MISIDSHSKQIKLLNDYIGALEKQINTCKTEIDQLQKSGGSSNNEEFNMLKN